MGSIMELQNVIYSVLLTQIQFGAYRFGDSLSTMEETAGHFLVSLDTVRSAYHRLKQEKYISLSKNVGAFVTVQYDEKEIEKHIQDFFVQREKSILDVSRSTRLLLGRAQWLSLKYTSPENLKKMEPLADISVPAAHTTLQHLKLKYEALGNDLLMRLVWQVYMFFQAPFFSLAENLQYVDTVTTYVPSILRFCRQKEWGRLLDTVNGFHDKMSSGLCRFYADRIITDPAQRQISFDWRSSQKPSQRFYSLAAELLHEISSGVYPANSILPTQARLAREKGVSVSTVRRASELLREIGVIRSTPRVGTEVFPFGQKPDYYDFSQPVIRKCLLRFVQSMQIFVLSIRAVSEAVFCSLDAEGLTQWKKQLLAVRERGRYELCVNAALIFIFEHAPSKAIRVIYRELYQQLFWGYPIRALWGDQDAVNSHFLPVLTCLADCLDRADASEFSRRLEGFMAEELRLSVHNLLKLGIGEAEVLLLPDRQDFLY